MATTTHPHSDPNDSVSGDADMDSSHDLDDGNVKAKKKRRVVKVPDKKYECSQPQCGKSYSRAEHLYRHQLNHTPKQIYRCDFVGCQREFVRADLCARHKERHTAKGSHLQRKDAFMSSQRPTAPTAATTDTATPAHLISPTDSTRSTNTMRIRNPADAYMPSPSTAQPPYSHPSDRYHPSNGVVDVSAPHNVAGVHHRLPPATPAYTNSSYPQNNYNPAAAPQPVLPHPQSPKGPPMRLAYDQTGPGSAYDRPPPQSMTNGGGGVGGGGYPQQPMTVNQMHPAPPMSSGAPNSSSPHQSSTSMYMPQNHTYSNNTLSNPSNFRATPPYQSISTLPPFALPRQPTYTVSSNAGPTNALSPSPMVGMEPYDSATGPASGLMDYNSLDPSYASGFAMPVFGSDGFNRSPPSAIDMQFLSQLIDTNGFDVNIPSPPAPEPMQLGPPIGAMSTARPDAVDPKDETSSAGAQEPWDSSSPTVSEMDLDLRESQVTDKKQHRIIEMLSGYKEIRKSTDRKTKADIMAGDYNDPQHTLSVHMLKTYLTSYWIHIHQQMPILHRPTFNAETCPDLLLLAMMCLGACCLERSQSVEQIHNCAEMAYFAAHHIRWEIFDDPEFRPTAKLWTFQTMLLLELFEKMYSTRALHERAHIHHATTLTVMRRGSSLIGRSVVDPGTSNSNNDPTRTPPGPDGSINTSGQNTADAWWNRWITAEATRRVAFAAFVIDSTHATLFGHSAVMSPHDMGLPLPCDEALWSATSSAEVQRVEASLAANGFKPLTFLDGLKTTLNGHKVRTNTFGRVIIMAGLLNISWHMNQRDEQIKFLKAKDTLGVNPPWRASLRRAFDFWQQNFDDSLSKNDHWLQVCNPNAKDRHSVHQRDSVFESRTCLYSLAHMANHVDIIDCQIFAGAKVSLGRTVTEYDRHRMQIKMCKEWAPSARARDATFYALRFLCEVLIPAEDLSGSKLHSPSAAPTFTYSARDDYLLNRPWILYFAVMIVWSYGYALDGPIPASAYTHLTTREAQIVDMQRFLIRLGGVPSPEHLETVEQRNSCLGLLMLLRECFRSPRWELLHEASDMIGCAIELLVPAYRDVKTG